MTAYLTHGIIQSFIFFQMVVLLTILSNILVIHRYRILTQITEFPSVSILVPARNEEKNIHGCIQSLLAQDYPNYEIIALDDQSIDHTLTILKRFTVPQSSLKLIEGTPPPEGYAGKNWACAQLVELAQGDLLLFTDADTVFKPQAVREIVMTMLGEQADLLTGYPKQELSSWGERLLVPFFLWSVLCFTPLWLGYRLPLSALSSAVGQMLLFRRAAYKKIGGHAALGTAIVEDIELVRRVKSARLRWRMMNLTDKITCRMYPGSREALDGFTKNVFAIFNFHLAVFLFVYIWLGALFLEPLIVLIARMLGLTPTASLSELAACIGLSLLVWCIPYIELGFPLPLGFIYPITILANEAAAFRSLILSLIGHLSWKGRPLARPKWKWL
jgi:chlorobactene glucosyltransferase